MSASLFSGSRCVQVCRVRSSSFYCARVPLWGTDNGPRATPPPFPFPTPRINSFVGHPHRSCSTSLSRDGDPLFPAAFLDSPRTRLRIAPPFFSSCSASRSTDSSFPPPHNRQDRESPLSEAMEHPLSPCNIPVAAFSLLRPCGCREWLSKRASFLDFDRGILPSPHDLRVGLPFFSPRLFLLSLGSAHRFHGSPFLPPLTRRGSPSCCRHSQESPFFAPGVLPPSRACCVLGVLLFPFFFLCAPRKGSLPSLDLGRVARFFGTHRARIFVAILFLYFRLCGSFLLCLTRLF